MPYEVQLERLAEQPIAVVRGLATIASLPANIRHLFDRFYADFVGKGGLNIVLYPGNVTGEFEIACGVQVEQGGNAVTPAGEAATAIYMGPYHLMKAAHLAIHRWARENGRQLAGPSWEVYGHWSDDPAKLRTDIFYLLL